VNELRMTLKAQHLIIDVIGGKRAKVAGRNYRGVLRQSGHLILMADQ